MTGIHVAAAREAGLVVRRPPHTIPVRRAVEQGRTLVPVADPRVMLGLGDGRVTTRPAHDLGDPATRALRRARDHPV